MPQEPLMDTYPNSFSVYVIPHWTYKSILRNKLNIIDVADYSKIKAILSNSDLIDWTEINDFYKFLGKCSLSTHSLETLFKDITEAELTSYRTSVVPLSQTGATIKRLTAHVSDVNSMTHEPSYHFILMNTTLLVILGETFFTKTTDSEFVFRFVQDYLKECYKIAPIPEVTNQTDVFSLYLNLLK